MSSMRNAVQRRAHRERGQLPSRRHLGLLEKHKDYSLRAADYKKKQATLKSLRRKAADRNEDEFDFGMLSRAGPGSRLSRGKRWSGAVDGNRGNTALNVDVVRLLKTQDAGYLRTVRNVAAKEVRRLEERVVMAGGTAALGNDMDANEDGSTETRQRKIVFMDAPEERDAALKDLGLQQDDDDNEDEDDMEGDDSGVEGDSKGAEVQKTTREYLERRLRSARARLKALTDAEDELEMQRARMAKTATVGGVTKKGKTFKVRERKR